MLVAFGCGGGGGGGGGGPDAGRGSQSSPASPVIESLTASPTTVGTSGTTISAIVSDPQGIADLAGGTLIDHATGMTYGAFGTPGGQGTFVFTLTWDAMNTAQSIDLATGASAPRIVTAKFFDNEGNTATQDVTLELACDQATQAACGGKCVDLDSDVGNCGACGTGCVTNATGSVKYASCGGGQCVFAEQSTARESCDAVCGASNATCEADTCPFIVDGGASLYTTTGEDITCSTTPPTIEGGGGYVQIDCCCHD